ncbi:MAG: hypothetical protein RMN52_15270 [Anaerolineae bacterium]|nr:hypothetical protein [Candidatus Roseilinea sp.]MDW8451359.1 hypothetical protein [Anaerolineae bacterium]
MSFTVNDLQDLTRLLATHPEWLSEVRRLVLTNELLALPDIVRELVEAQRRTEERLDQLAEAQRRTEERLNQLAEAQRRTEERLNLLAVRVDELAARMDQLAARMDELATRMDQLAQAQRYTEERLDRLTMIVERLVNQMAEVRGDTLEMKFRDKAPAYFGRWLRRVRVVPVTDIEAQLETKLNDREMMDLFALDVLVHGQVRSTEAKGEDVWLAVEVSSVVDERDVQRAERRAALLRRAGLRAVPVAAGARINAEAESVAELLHVALLRDGVDQGWEQAYAAAMAQ